MSIATHGSNAVLDVGQLAGVLQSATLARQLLDGVGTRLEHAAGVARQAERLAGRLDPPWREAAMAAAWLHDVGYSPAVLECRFHPLDAARWLRDHRWTPETCRLVAWHSSAGVEASLLGLDEILASEFERPPTPAQDVLTWADMTTSPTGEIWTVDQRLADILDRYPSDSIVHRAVLESAPELCESVERIERLLREII